MELSLSYERRRWEQPGAEIRLVEPLSTGPEGTQVALPPKIRGHAALFNSRSENLGGFYEEIAPGAFTESIAADDVRALWNHNDSFVLGRNRANTLRLFEDSQGLGVEIDPPDAQWARDLLGSMKRGDVTQMSFGFRVLTDSIRKIDGLWVRRLEKVRLFDVSPVTFPAYTGTDVSVRSAAESPAELRGMAERIVRFQRMRLRLHELN